MSTPDPTDRPHVVVVGAGISGLAAAYALGQAGVRVTVLEASERVGGKLETGTLDGVPLDTGAESMLARRPEAVALAREVGLAEDLVSPAVTQAAVWTRGALRPLPSGTLLGLPGDLRALAHSGLLSVPELARVPLDHWLGGRPLTHDVAIGTWAASRVGRAVVDRLVEPLLGGVYGGHADRLSLEMTLPQLFSAAQREPSLLTAVRNAQRAGRPASGAPVFAGIRGGVGRLPGAVAAASGADVRTRACVRSLTRTPGGWRLTVGSAHAPEEVDADAVVLAVPGPAAARLLAGLDTAAARDIGALEYASVALVSMLLPSGTDLPRALGSGFLVPPVEGTSVKAATFSSRKWSWVAGEARGRLLVRASLGRAGEQRVLQREDTGLVALARQDLETVTGLRAAPVETLVNRWGGSLPQYAPGHRAMVARVRRGLARQPGLALCGAAYDGIGIPACIASGREAAANVLTALASRPLAQGGQ